jgi:peroxin-2
MFAIPRLPRLPSYLAPITYISAMKTLLSRPNSIDYTSIPLLPSSSAKASGKASREASSGPFADLPLSSCPICHQRRAAAPVPLSDSETGAEINLPPTGVEGGDEEEKIFVPAETDCWGGCRWCYYCIATELAKHAEERAKVELAEQAKSQGKKEGPVQEPALKWECLRCGGGVTRAWRAGPEPLLEEPVEFVGTKGEERSQDQDDG